MVHDVHERIDPIVALGLEKYWYADHPEFKRASNQPGTLREQLDIIHGRAPAEPLPDAYAERLAETMLRDPLAWGGIMLRCISAAQAGQAGAA
ncbi:MAG: hypothetical protein O2955_12075 [Planctomycetota bacterium]|nr:hypothetical protein [Planctomycetota bacterium]MDA1213249.1 hypothetical protein [Planctomycetota bacterium]